MSNSKYNALTLMKRPAKFLMDNVQVGKDFGGLAKRPKLDVRLTPSSSNTVNNVVTSTSGVRLVEDAFDDLWGDELSEEAVEECLFLASQVYPEANLGVQTSVPPQEESQQDANKAIITSKISTDIKFKAPEQFIKPSALNSYLKSRKPTNSPASKTSRSSTSNNTDIVRVGGATSFHLKYSNAAGTTNKYHAVDKSSSQTNNINHNSLLTEDLQSLQLENQRLKDSDLSRNGEISILRMQLKQMQMQLENERLDNIRHLDNQGQKYKDQLKEQKKELEMTNTQLQFKIMEVATMKNHCNLLESGSKMRLKEPQPSTTIADSSRMQFESFSEGFFVPNKIPHSAQTSSPTKSHVRVCHQRQVVEPAHCAENLAAYPIPVVTEPKLDGPTEGSILGLLVNEFLFDKSTPEISWILYIRKKQSLSRSIKEAEDINSTILLLQQNDKTLENCYTAVNKLIAMVSLNSQIAQPPLEKVVQECQEIVCRQMHILRLLLKVQPKAERVVLNEDIASSIGSLASHKGTKLLSARQWYNEEEGVESRRALGLLCVIAEISHLAANLITGTEKPTTKNETNKETEQNLTDRQIKSSVLTEEKYSRSSIAQSAVMCETNIEPKPSISAMQTDTVGQEAAIISSNHSSKSSYVQSRESIVQVDYTEYMGKPFGFLCLLRDIAVSISIQRRTKSFIGLLASMVQMLKTVVSRSPLIDYGLKLMCEIVQEVVFACPQMEVIVSLFELLRVLAPYTEIMDYLCRNCESNALVEKKYINLAYFSRGSCVLQVLFRLLPTSQLSLQLHTTLCSHMVHWLFSIVCVPQKETAWLFSLQDDLPRTCYCKQKLTQGLVTTLYHSICDFERTVAKGGNIPWELRRAMCMGVMLLRSLLQQDELFGLYLEIVEGEYQLFLSNMQKLEDKLNMNPLQRECLTELLKIEKADIDEQQLENVELYDDYWERVVDICKPLLSWKGLPRQKSKKS